MAIDLEKLRKYVNDKLAGKTMGYQFYAVNTAVELGKKNHRIGDVHGFAVRKQDPFLLSRLDYAAYYATGVLMSEARRLEINSMSKTITAAAAMKLIHEKDGASLNSRIVDFLPSYWKRGNNVEDIRLVQALTHVSGLTEYREDGEALARNPKHGGNGYSPCYYRSIKKSIEKAPSGLGVYLYQNVNSAMFRLIIPYMLRRSFWELRCFGHGMCAGNDFSPFDELRFNQELSSEYVAFVRDQVLAPCGIEHANVQNYLSDVPNRSYRLDDSSKAPESDLQYTFTKCASQGWKLSAREYCKFIVGLTKGAFFLPSVWKTMLQFKIGLRSWPGYGRLYHGHGGLGTWHQSGWTWIPDASIPDKGLCMVVLTNSRRNDDDLDHLPHFLGNAYDECS